MAINSNPPGPAEGPTISQNAGTQVHTPDPAGQQVATIQNGVTFAGGFGKVQTGARAEGTGSNIPINTIHISGSVSGSVKQNEVVTNPIMTVKQEKFGVVVQKIKNPA